MRPHRFPTIAFLPALEAEAREPLVGVRSRPSERDGHRGCGELLRLEDLPLARARVRRLGPVGCVGLDDLACFRIKDEQPLAVSEDPYLPFPVGKGDAVSPALIGYVSVKGYVPQRRAIAGKTLAGRKRLHPFGAIVLVQGHTAVFRVAQDVVRYTCRSERGVAGKPFCSGAPSRSPAPASAPKNTCCLQTSPKARVPVVLLPRKSFVSHSGRPDRPSIP